MKIAFPLVALATCGVLSTAAAQRAAPSGGAPVADALRANLERASRNLVAAAEEMPDSKYAFKPTPAQMSFGDIIEHLAGGNDYLCSKIAGGAAPKRTEIKTTAGKEKLIARLRETFDYCGTSLAKVDDSALGEQIPFFGGQQITRAAAMMATVEDWGDHYSQLAIYLRMNGHLPPTAKQKQG